MTKGRTSNLITIVLTNVLCSLVSHAYVTTHQVFRDSIHTALVRHEVIKKLQLSRQSTANARHQVLFASVVSTSDSEFSSFQDNSNRNQKKVESRNSIRSSPRTSNNDNSKRFSKYQVRELFRSAKELERKGEWRKATSLLQKILELDPTDAHSYLALARLEARRTRRSPDLDNKASEIFANGTRACPKSVHLWQAWAVYEESRGNVNEAKRLFETALKLDPYNPYVCHAYGLMIRRGLGDGASFSTEAFQLWERSLGKHSTAALVCSLGEMLIADNQLEKARELYSKHIMNLTNEREKTEVYLAMAWLEERYFSNFDQAEKLLEMSLVHSPTSSVAQVALARLKGRMQQRRENIVHFTDGSNVKFNIDESRAAMTRSLASACVRIENESADKQPVDGRMYNAWANLEVKSNRLKEARKILLRGLSRYPRDHSLLQAAGKVEERLGNYSGAKDFYRASLLVEPSAPALVAFALLEVLRPSTKPNVPLQFEQIERLFEEALLLDPRHGPAYNAYARCVFEHSHNESNARDIYIRGVRANCTDVASIYHGYGRLELMLGNVDRARSILMEGQHQAFRVNVGMDSPHRERASFLTHTLGMLELNSNRPADGLRVFLNGIEQYGNSSQLLLGAALCEVKLGNEKKARELFERSVLNDDKHGQAWHAWGLMEMRAGNFETAKTLFECGVKTVPKYGALWQAYGAMLGRMGRMDEARGLFQRGIEMSPKYVPLYQSWASMELREENFSAARALIAKALTIDKRNGSVWLVAAEIEELAGNSGLVKLLLRRGIECSPSNPKLYRALGDALVRQGKIIEAREVMEKGIDVDPLHAPLYHSLAELEARIFNIEGLAKLNKRAASIFNANAMQPSPRSSEAWGSKIRAGRSREIPKGVAALAQRIVEDDATDPVYTYSDTEQFLDGMISSTSLLEDELVDELLLVGNNVHISEHSGSPN